MQKKKNWTVGSLSSLFILLTGFGLLITLAHASEQSFFTHLNLLIPLQKGTTVAVSENTRGSENTAFAELTQYHGKSTLNVRQKGTYILTGTMISPAYRKLKTSLSNFDTGETIWSYHDKKKKNDSHVLSFSQKITLKEGVYRWKHSPHCKVSVRMVNLEKSSILTVPPDTPQTASSLLAPPPPDVAPVDSTQKPVTPVKPPDLNTGQPKHILPQPRPAAKPAPALPAGYNKESSELDQAERLSRISKEEAERSAMEIQREKDYEQFYAQVEKLEEKHRKLERTIHSSENLQENNPEFQEKIQAQLKQLQEEEQRLVALQEKLLIADKILPIDEQRIDQEEKMRQVEEIEMRKQEEMMAAEEEKMKIEEEKMKREEQRMKKEMKRMKEEEQKLKKEDKAYRKMIEMMEQDNLINGEEAYSIEITKDFLRINGKRQPDNVFQKYKRLFKDATGYPMTEDKSIKITKHTTVS